MTSDDVVDVLARAIRERGAPKRVRSDNGPEFVAKELRSFFGRVGIGTLFVDPGSPWQNGYSESFNGRLSNELLDAETFANLGHAKERSAAWRHEYNHERPHSSLGYLPPARLAATLAGPPLGAAPLAAVRPASS